MQTIHIIYYTQRVLAATAATAATTKNFIYLIFFFY